VRDAVKSRGFPILSTEGEDNGEWIIVDCGAAVAHIMQPPIREYYHLEEIWGGKAVRMKVGEVSNRLVKASEPEPAPRAAPKAAAKKPAAQKPPARKAAATKSGSRSAAPAKSPTRKAADKSAAYQRVGARRPTGKTTSTQTVARKTPARKAPRSA
jgi:ribosome-associated protein